MREEWRSANRFILLPEGSHYFPVILSAIDRARHFLLIEQYFVKSGRLLDLFIEALVDASGRGVSVLLLLDSYGAQGMEGHDRDLLEQAGVAVRNFNPLAVGRLSGNLTRDHRKLIVVDQAVAYTGGFCLVDEFLDTWYDVAVQIEGPVISDWTRLFCRLWNSPAARGKTEASKLPAVRIDGRPGDQEANMRGRVVWARGYRYQAIRQSLYKRIDNGQQRLWLCTPYFAPSGGLRRRLIRMARAGMDVRLLLPGSHNNDHPGVHYAGQRLYKRLLKAGVRIFEFQPAFIHAKYCLVDDWATIGSFNFDHWSLHWNLEANQEIDDPEFAASLAALFEENFQASREIDPKIWARRSLGQRLREWLFGGISRWLTHFR